MQEVLPLSAYCALYHESPSAVTKRIDRGIWREGVHFHKIEGVRERWLDTKAINKWARNQ